ncbi:unnamed protein product [Phytophthora lilii]|uniref:Unnamed protein product n=1 Tax=Phytophthora lilii TaxID=2077276 RepID=A0A9W6WGV2_9STRA|nr:unnamed protein product [Phytophthora lilii]
MSSRLLAKDNDKPRYLRQSTKIVVATKTPESSLPPGEAIPTRRHSHVSVMYGRMLETTEAEGVCKRLGMTKEDVRRLRRKFDEEDGMNTDTVTIRGFFHLINDDKSFKRSHMLTKELLRLANIEPELVYT